MKQQALITHTLRLAASAEQAFWGLLEEAREKGFDSSFDYWRPRDWPPIVGTHNDFKMRAGRFSMRGVSRFSDFDPPHRLAIESVRPAGPIQIRMSWTFVPIANESEYTYAMEMLSPTGLGWLTRLILSKYDRKLTEDLPHIAKIFDADPSKR